MNQNLNRIAISMFTLLLIVSCENAAVETSSKKIEILPGIEDRSFELFWDDFHEAVLNDDLEALIQLTQFKLEAKGITDSDPTILYSEKEFPIVFHAFLNQMSGAEGKQVEKEGELIERTKTLTSTIQKDFTKVGGLEFAKNNGVWKLTTVHLSGESKDEIETNLSSKNVDL